MRPHLAWLRVALMLAVSSLAATGVAAGAPADAAAGTAPVRLVKVHADWCGTCVALEPTWSALVEQFGDRLETHVFDVTDRNALRAAQQEAEAIGLADFLAVNKGRTGTIALIAPDGRVIESFKGELRVEPYEAALGEWEREHSG